jgi:beta-1,4-N-acetylglucosaminyltransferase
MEHSDLPAALGASEKKRKARTPWQPVNPGADPTGKGIVGVMDEELGYENRMRETLD